MTSVDITVFSTDEVCRLLGIEERRLKQLIRDRVLIEARDGNGARGIPQDVIVKGVNGWERSRSWRMMASRPRNRWRGCTPFRTSSASARSMH